MQNPSKTSDKNSQEIAFYNDLVSEGTRIQSMSRFGETVLEVSPEKIPETAIAFSVFLIARSLTWEALCWLGIILFRLPVVHAFHCCCFFMSCVQVIKIESTLSLQPKHYVTIWRLLLAC